MASQVDCAKHGHSGGAFICSHLLGASGMDFVQSDEDDPETARRSAWCGECEAFREAHDGWNDEFPPPAGIVLVCEHCYDEMATRNVLVDD